MITVTFHCDTCHKEVIAALHDYNRVQSSYPDGWLPIWGRNGLDSDQAVAVVCSEACSMSVFRRVDPAVYAFKLSGCTQASMMSHREGDVCSCTICTQPKPDPDYFWEAARAQAVRRPHFKSAVWDAARTILCRNVSYSAVQTKHWAAILLKEGPSGSHMLSLWREGRRLNMPHWSAGKSKIVSGDSE